MRESWSAALITWQNVIKGSQVGSIIKLAEVSSRCRFTNLTHLKTWFFFHFSFHHNNPILIVYFRVPSFIFWWGNAVNFILRWVLATNGILCETSLIRAAVQDQSNQGKHSLSWVAANEPHLQFVTTFSTVMSTYSQDVLDHFSSLVKRASRLRIIFFDFLNFQGGLWTTSVTVS